MWNYLSVKANSAGERFSRISGDSHVLARPYLADVVREVNRVTLMSSQSEWISILTRLETKWNDTHSYQVTTMNSLEAFRNNCFNSLVQIK